MKKIVSLILCLTIISSCIVTGVAAFAATPIIRIYGISNGSIIGQGDSVKAIVEVSEASEETTLYLDDEALANAADNVYTINNINNGRHILKAKAVIDGTEYCSDDVVFYVAFGRQTYGDFEATFENTFNFTNSSNSGYRGSSNVFAQTPANPKGFSYKISNAKNGMLIFDDFNSSTLHTAERVWEFDMYVDDVANADFETYFYVGGFDSSFKGYLLRKGADGLTVFKGADNKEYPCTEETWYHVTVKYNYSQGRVELFADIYGDDVPVSLGIYTFPKISGIPSSIRMVTNGTAYSVYFDNSTCKETHYSPYVKSIKFYANGTEYTEDTIPANPDKIVLVLNEKKLSASERDFTVTVSDGTNTITPAISDKTTENNTITLNFRTPLKQSTTYTITISSGLSSYKWAYGTTSQSYKFTTLFDFNLYGISDYSRLNGDVTTKLTAVSGQKGDISLYVDGKRYAVQNDVTEAVFELKDLVYGEHKLYAKVEDYGLMTSELTFYNYNESKTELASNREFTSTEENTRFGVWGAKHGTIATPGKTDEKSYILMKKGSKDSSQIITTVGRTEDADLFNEERVLDFDLYIDEVGDNNMDLHIYSDKCYRVSSIILPSDTGSKSVFKGPAGKEYPIIEDYWYHASVKFNFARGTIETFVDVYGDGNPVSLGRNTFSANAGNETLYIYANILGKNVGASEVYIDNIVLSDIDYATERPFDVSSYTIKNYSVGNVGNDVSVGDNISFEVKITNNTESTICGNVYFVVYEGCRLAYIDVQPFNIGANGVSLGVSSIDTYIVTSSATKVGVLVWKDLIPLFKPIMCNLKLITPTPSAPTESVELSVDYGAVSLVNEDKSLSPSSYLGDYNRPKAYYENTVCLSANKNYLMLDGKKYSIEKPTYYESGTMLIPIDVLSSLYGFEVEFSDDASLATIDGIAVIKENDTSFRYYDRTISFSVPVKKMNGTLYVELSPVVEGVLNSHMYLSEYGISVISAEELSDYPYQRELACYLVYDRPNASTIYKTLTNKYGYKEHPRILFTEEEFEEAMELAEIDSNAAKWENTVMKNADESLELHSMPKFGYDSGGIRVQGIPGARFVLELYWAYQKTGDTKYAEYLKEYMLALCDYPTWGHNTHFIEVGSASMCMALSFDLFYDYFTKEERDIIANRIMEYALKPAYERYYGNHPFGGVNWPTDKENWNVVVNKGIIAAALAIGDEYETDYCMNIVEKGIKSLEYIFPTFAPDGMYPEGPAYWEYCVENCILALKTLDTCLGTDYGLGDSVGFKETSVYPRYISGREGAFAYHDTPRHTSLNSVGSVYYLAEKFNMPEIGRLQLDTMQFYGSTGDILSLLFYNPDFVSSQSALNSFDTVMYSKNIDTATIRSDWSNNATWLGIHAGLGTAAPHGHVDIGTFEFESNGVRFASEMGRDDYNLKDYWDTKNPTAYVIRAEGHNVYVINPDESAGQNVDAYAPLEQVKVTDDSAVYTVDMTSAYAEDVTKAVRGYMLSHDRKVFTLQDEITPKGNDSYYWFWHTDASISIAADGRTATLTKSGKSITVYFDSNVDFTVSAGRALPLDTSPKVEDQLAAGEHQINKITVRFNSTKAQDIVFRATAVPQSISYTLPGQLTPISDW